MNTEERKIWISKKTKGEACNIYKHRYGGIDFYSWRILYNKNTPEEHNVYQVYIEGCEFDDKEFPSYKVLFYFVRDFINCFVPQNIQNEKLKSELKSSLQSIITLLDEKEEDVLHDYGKSSLEVAEEMIDNLRYGKF